MFLHAQFNCYFTSPSQVSFNPPPSYPPIFSYLNRIVASLLSFSSFIPKIGFFDIYISALIEKGILPFFQ
jgi:hypothetical protein